MLAFDVDCRVNFYRVKLFFWPDSNRNKIIKYMLKMCSKFCCQSVIIMSDDMNVFFIIVFCKVCQ